MPSGQFAHWVRPGKVRCSSTYNPQSNIFVTAYHNNGLVIVALNMGGIRGQPDIHHPECVRHHFVDADPNLFQPPPDAVKRRVGNNNTFTYSLGPQTITTFAQFPVGIYRLRCLSGCN